jgi:flagellar basal-body rod protein FlgG
MLPIYASPVSGLQASQQSLDITANNIANADTPGFDSADPVIEDLIYQGTDARDLVASNVTTTSLGVGARLEAAPRALQPGSPVVTGNPLDVAITGDGYLQVQQPGGTLAYTRAGMIRLDGQGRLTIQGAIVQPPITLPPGASSPFITNGGQVTATTPTGQQVIGQIQLARFINEQGLQAVGSTLYVPTVASGPPIVGNPLSPGFGGLQAGALEAARVDLSKEMSALIVAERAYGLDSRVLQTVDHMVGDVTSRA